MFIYYVTDDHQELSTDNGSGVSKTLASVIANLYHDVAFPENLNFHYPLNRIVDDYALVLAQITNLVIPDVVLLFKLPGLDIAVNDDFVEKLLNGEAINEGEGRTVALVKRYIAECNANIGEFIVDGFRIALFRNEDNSEHTLAIRYAGCAGALYKQFGSEAVFKWTIGANVELEATAEPAERGETVTTAPMDESPFTKDDSSTNDAGAVIAAE